MRTTIDLPDDLAREVKIRAVEETRKLNDVFADLLRRALAEEHRESTPERVAKVLQNDTGSFLDLRGSFKVGPGDPVEDVRRARRRIGTEGA